MKKKEPNMTVIEKADILEAHEVWVDLADLVDSDEDKDDLK